MAQCGSGIWPTSTSPAPSRSSTSITPAGTSGNSPALFPDDDKARKHWLARCLGRLEKGQIEALVKILRALQPASEELAKSVRNESQYFERNAERMRYPTFRAQGLFVGSGVVEAACKTVIGARLKMIRHVLDRPWRQRHHRTALLPPQSEVRRLLG